MSRGSDWHKNTQKEMIKEYEEEGYFVKRERKLGFESKISRVTQFKQVDLIAEKNRFCTKKLIGTSIPILLILVFYCFHAQKIIFDSQIAIKIAIRNTPISM